MKFSHLTVQGLPKDVKLVVLVGPNGSGKTSLLEGLYVYFYENGGGRDFYKDVSYSSNYMEPEIKFHDPYLLEGSELKQSYNHNSRAFYFRTAHRHEADFGTSEVRGPGSISDDHRNPKNFNDLEARVSRNYQELVATAVKELFSEENASKKVKDVREGLIGQVRSSMKRVFDDLILQGVGMPTEDGTFTFKRGASRDYRYANLSGGEKAAFDLLLDFIIEKEDHNDTIYCIDEPELHMHTRLQGKLLEELYTILPENCQLWIATHSIGMMRRAMELHRDNPGTVAFLNFDSEVHDFDEPVVMEPTEPGRQLWKHVFAVALDELADLVAPREVVFCEGKPEHESSRRAPTFDAEVYRTIFQNEKPDTEFIPLGGATGIEKDPLLIIGIFQKLFEGMQTWRLLDGDERTEAEREKLRSKGINVLRVRDLENYLWADEIIKKLCTQEGLPEKAGILIECKNKKLRELPQEKADDVKAVRDSLWAKFKKELNLDPAQRGNSPEAFARQTLAPLITPDTKVYKELEKDILGPLDKALEQNHGD